MDRPPAPPAPPGPPCATEARPGWFGDAVVDLVAGSTCLGCGRPGRLVCRACRATLAVPPAPAVVRPWPRGLGPVWSAAPHVDLPRALVVGHKERAQLGLRRPLADLLAGAVAAGATAALDPGAIPGTAPAPPAGRLLLCPVPSRPGTARRRGHDPLRALVRGAAARLRGGGWDVRTVDLLVAGRARDQGELGALERQRNLRGTMHCPSPRLARSQRACPRAWVVVCDDVVTTGSTLVEATRALAAVGVPVLVAATVTSTPRRGGAAVTGRG
ncbi:phosphoribosyltransferase family protein [Nocardioides sp. ChNu-99]|uniref:ComF family protein n=1 Tax=Nocardioides sp. ChNu-99 TaxID=2839897 RepID=UPI0024060B45|nr:phosphoribosyltransferase family protein [Nocardioides sp. ChNu-99]MDF9717566.1 ComF family protein [Nocardioides sp. ChNu-99]